MQIMMPDLDRLRRRLADRNLSEVARRTGLHRNALYRFMAGRTVPRYASVLEIVRYFDEQERGGEHEQA